LAHDPIRGNRQITPTATVTKAAIKIIERGGD
jgi:hypothetical protein